MLDGAQSHDGEWESFAPIVLSHDHLFEHYEYTYGANGYLFSAGDVPANTPTHFFTVGSGGARVDSLYGGFFTHSPFVEKKVMYDIAGDEHLLEFIQRPWSKENVKRESPGVRFQDPAVYPEAASFYSYPFDSRADADAGRYSDDPATRYSDDAEFFGYTYGEGSIHYLWMEIDDDTCTIAAHYADGPPGVQGPPIMTPDGAVQRWTITR